MQLKLSTESKNQKIKATVSKQVCVQLYTSAVNVSLLEHSNSGKKSFDSILATELIFFDSNRQSDKFAASTLIFK